MQHTVFIVEDDEVIASKIKEHLEKWDFTVAICRNFHNVLDEFVKVMPDLVLMDVTLPYKNGYEWTKQIRTLSKAPILFVSSADDNLNQILALDQGADDYITKPFDIDYLRAKIQALLRRSYDFSGKTTWLEHNGLRFNTDENLIRYEDKEAGLTGNEAKILKLLMESKGKIVSREALMEYLWKTDCYVDENALSVNINRLRKKLTSVGAIDFIETKKGAGYLI